MSCESHKMLTDELNRVKDDISAIYNLDRTRGQVMADINTEVAELKVEQKQMNEAIKDLKKGQAELDTKVTKLDKTVTAINETTSGMQKDIKSIQNTIKGNKWQPKDYCVIIVALLSLAGSIITTLLK